MPWKETTQVQERYRFIEEWLADEHDSIAALCAAHGVSRKTGYKWIARFKEGGAAALDDLPRRWRDHPHKTPPVMVEQIVAMRRKHPRWGPKKLQLMLADAGYDPPARSTIGVILKQQGCIQPKRRRSAPGDYSNGLTPQKAPNAVWSTDFKGWFKLRSGVKCYPLTVLDGFSRYLLRCEGLEHPDELACREAFHKLFCEFGLPEVMRSDNGPPFSAKHGTSTLSLWWVKLGICPERIQRGKPQQNGRHERMHRTLKLEALDAASIEFRMYKQQRVFDRFRHEYNSVRPHEALRNQVPASLYTPSNRRYPCKLRSPEYGYGFEVYVVRTDGTIQIPGRHVFLSTVLAGEPIGLKDHEDGTTTVHYGPLRLGMITCRRRFVRGPRPRKRRTGSESDELSRTSEENQGRHHETSKVP